MRGSIAQLDPILHRQRDGTRVATVVRVPMKIGPTGCKQFQPGCNVAVPLDRFRVVIRVIGLDRIEARLHVRGNTRIDVRLPGVRKRSKTARDMYDVDHLAGRRAASWNERGTAGCQPSIERLASVGDISGGDHRSRDLRPPHGTSAWLPRLQQDRSDINRHPKLREAQAERFDAGDPLRTLLRKERRQSAVAWIDEVPKHVYVAAIAFDGSNFDPGNRFDAAGLRR